MSVRLFDGARGERMKGSRTSVAVFMLAVFAAWQLGALVHFATVPHELSPRGKIVPSCDDGHQHGSRGADPANDGREGRDECRFVASITQARADLAPGVPVTAIAAPPEAPAAPVDADLQFLPTDDLYLTAPTHSPPAFS
jgi:hypothetical protein